MCVSYLTVGLPQLFQQMDLRQCRRECRERQTSVEDVNWFLQLVTEVQTEERQIAKHPLKDRRFRVTVAVWTVLPWMQVQHQVWAANQQENKIHCYDIL